VKKVKKITLQQSEPKIESESAKSEMKKLNYTEATKKKNNSYSTAALPESCNCHHASFERL
jgi:ubiquitin